MIAKKKSVLLGAFLMFPSSLLIADTAFDRALGKGVTQNYQGLNTGSREIYPGVWSRGTTNKNVIREEVYPGVWRETVVSKEDYQDSFDSNRRGSGISIVNRTTENSRNSASRSNIQERDQDRNFQSSSSNDSQATSSNNSRSTSSNNSSQRQSSSIGGFSGRSSANTNTRSIPNVTIRDREYTNVTSLIDPDFD